MFTVESIDKDRIPKHIAVIMDGNGRWAKKQGKPRVFGHKSAIKSVREVTEGCAELGVKYLTLYAFSTENWKRPKLEVNLLMELLVSTMNSEIDEFHKNNIRLRAIGDIAALPKQCAEALERAMDITKDNTHMDLVIALSYGSRQEIVEATKAIAQKVMLNKLKVEEIDVDLISNHLYTYNIPDPELLIRTSGEARLSNFLLWQMAYAEFFFASKYWPEFRKADLYEAIANYQNRQRRFGMTGDQLSTESPA